MQITYDEGRKRCVVSDLPDESFSDILEIEDGGVVIECGERRFYADADGVFELVAIAATVEEDGDLEELIEELDDDEDDDDGGEPEAVPA